jgi:predicted RNase H-like HicB family nuclease
MNRYTFTIVIQKEPEDPGYYAHCPALPGCFGAGLTVEETVEDMRAAMALYIESLVDHDEQIPADTGQPTIAEVTLDVPARAGCRR